MIDYGLSLVPRCVPVNVPDFWIFSWMNNKDLIKLKLPIVNKEKKVNTLFQYNKVTVDAISLPRPERNAVTFRLERVRRGGFHWLSVDY